MSSLLKDKTGMIAPKKSRQKQRIVIEFLLPEEETAQNINTRLKQVYGEGTIDYSTVTRWVKRINDRQEEPAESALCDMSRIRGPSSAHSSVNIDFMSKGATINSDVYIDTLKKLKARIQRVRPALEMSNFFCNMTTVGLIPASKPVRSSAPLIGQQFYIPPYSPDLVPSDFHLFGPLKESLKG